MKHLLLFFLIQACCCISYSQETERKVVYSRNGDKEVYYVLRSNNNIRHGSYEKKGNSGHITGYYRNGLRDDTWTEYSKGSRLRSRGAYRNNEPVGLWKFYNWEGELEQEYNFSTKELVSDVVMDALKEKSFRVIKGFDTTINILDRPPVYIGGKTKMETALMRESMIGMLIRITQVSGKIVVGFVIDTTGKVRDYRILSGIHQACDAEALQMVKQLPARWLPGVLNGTRVEVEHTMTIVCKNDS